MDLIVFNGAFGWPPAVNVPAFLPFCQSTTLTGVTMDTLPPPDDYGLTISGDFCDNLSSTLPDPSLEFNPTYASTPAFELTTDTTPLSDFPPAPRTFESLFPSWNNPSDSSSSEVPHPFESNHTYPISISNSPLVVYPSDDYLTPYTMPFGSPDYTSHLPGPSKTILPPMDDMAKQETYEIGELGKQTNWFHGSSFTVPSSPLPAGIVQALSHDPHPYTSMAHQWQGLNGNGPSDNFTTRNEGNYNITMSGGLHFHYRDSVGIVQRLPDDITP
ncbi:hypothetical protein WG66_000672 [Moniliophthora roreri]|nr:hypothetical protein WG66_000672 [Moniliophthora roreri]